MKEWCKEHPGTDISMYKYVYGSWFVLHVTICDNILSDNKIVHWEVCLQYNTIQYQISAVP